jgi:predicted nucleotidyltransferase
MSLSRKHLAENFIPVHFDPDQLAAVLKEKLPEVDFCFLMGSAVSGVVKAYSDLDLAFYLSAPSSFRFYNAATDVVHGVVPDVRVDIGILNSAEPVYRFESLRGRLLFARDEERYLTFYSRTCREYESQMFDYERQRRYRRANRTPSLTS